MFWSFLGILTVTKLENGGMLDVCWVTVIFQTTLTAMAFSAAQEAQVQKMIQKAVEDERKKQADNLRFGREMMIEQAKSKFKAPADKRAIGYLMEEEFDLKELLAGLCLVTGEDDNLLAVAENVDSYRKFAELAVISINMRCRKNGKEIEAYHVANNSQYGWSTEKFYNQGDSFKKNSDNPWYEEEELSVEKKLTKLRAAEKEAKHHKQDREREDQERRGVKRSRWSAAPATVTSQESTALQFGPSQLMFPPHQPGAAGPGYLPQPLHLQRSSFQCFNCLEFGHIKKNCPKLGK